MKLINFSAWKIRKESARHKANALHEHIMMQENDPNFTTAIRDSNIMVDLEKVFLEFEKLELLKDAKNFE
jgi:hypothetical protein